MTIVKKIIMSLLLASISIVGVQAIANPASVNCEEKGGTLEIRNDASGGQVGYCKFSNGTECEEWAYFRGECAGPVSCAGEGESIPVIAIPPVCCGGLTKISPKDPQLVGSSGICTSKCGDSVCNSQVESNYNCPSDCNNLHFSDIYNNTFQNYIVNLYTKKIINGSNGRFSPNEFVTRGQMAKFIVNGFDLHSTIGGSNFGDVPATNVFYNEILVLKNLGIVHGYGDGLYHPDDYVTREMASKYIVKALESKGVTIYYDMINDYIDVPAGNNFYVYINYLSNTSINNEMIMKGVGQGQFLPKEYLTRGAMAKIVDLSMNHPMLLNIIKQEQSCRNNGGNWNEGHNECGGVSKEACKAIGGTFNECASPCRYNADPNLFCIQMCEQVCQFTGV